MGWTLLNSGNSNALILFLSMGIAAVLGVSFYAWMITNRRRQKETLEFEWFDFMQAVKSNDIEKIKTSGDKVIWNWHLAPAERRVMLEELTKRIEDYPELLELWREVHNRTLGYYPSDSITNHDNTL